MREFAALCKTPTLPAASPSAAALLHRHAADGSNAKFEVIGGVTWPRPALRGADDLHTNSEIAALRERMKDSDFVALGGPAGETSGYQFAQVFGPGGARANGKLSSSTRRAGPRCIRSSALSRPPEEVVVMAFSEDKTRTPPRDRFPNLLSLQQSEDGKDFRRARLLAQRCL